MPAHSSTRDLGLLGEDLAIKFLKKNGYKILERNFRSKLGEVDIVAQDKDTLVFVEVKTRWSEKFGLPEEAITPWKIKSIIKTGQYFKLLHPELPDSLRIDVVVIELDGKGELKRIEILKNVTG